MDADDSGFLDQQKIAILADKLGLALTEMELQAAMIAVRTACQAHAAPCSTCGVLALYKYRAQL